MSGNSLGEGGIRTSAAGDPETCSRLSLFSLLQQSAQIPFAMFLAGPIHLQTGRNVFSALRALTAGATQLAGKAVPLVISHKRGPTLHLTLQGELLGVPPTLFPLDSPLNNQHSRKHIFLGRSDPSPSSSPGDLYEQSPLKLQLFSGCAKSNLNLGTASEGEKMKVIIQNLEYRRPRVY